MESPDSGHVVANAACGREVVGEVNDEQTHGGGVWIDEAEMITIAELDESLFLSGVVSGWVWVEGMSSHMLILLLKLMEGQVV